MPPKRRKDEEDHGRKSSKRTRRGDIAAAVPARSTPRNGLVFPSMTNTEIEEEDDEDSSSLTDISSVFEDYQETKDKGKAKAESESSEEEEVEWEDVLQDTIGVIPGLASSSKVGGDLELTLDKNRAPESSGRKKGASAEERRIRILTHCIHVQFLLFHGALRNKWICDPELQSILLSQLTPNIVKDVEKYQARQTPREEKQKRKTRESTPPSIPGSTTDPLIRLLGTLIHWWKKKFRVDTPGLRRNGYKTLSMFEREKEGLGEGEAFGFTTGNRDCDGNDTKTVFRNIGERIEGLQEFRDMAAECRGSRDTGAILFTGLLRALGLEARMISSLQPLGYGFAKAEDASGKLTMQKDIHKNEIATKKKNTHKKERGKGRGKGEGKSIVVDSDSETWDSSDEQGSGGFVRKPKFKPNPKKKTFDKDLPFPIFWTEVFSPTTKTWVSVDSLTLTVLGNTPDLFAKFEPKGIKAASAKQVIAYVVAYSSDGTAKDVTTRYLAKNEVPGKTKTVRIPSTQIPIYNVEGMVVATQKHDWFDGVMRGYRKPTENLTESDQVEDMELRGVPVLKTKKEGTHSINAYKNNSKYVLERHLKRDEAVKSGKTHVKMFTAGKGEKAKQEKVYVRDDIVSCKAVENWYKEGRVIKEGEQPLKQVKRRAATLNRKREIEEAQKEGETLMQGLYSEEQTELYIPPPIVDGKVPRNGFGNIDIYVSTMIPQGAVHLPLKGSGRIAKKLGIDYADAVTGFEFKKQRAVPFIEGIVVAEESSDVLRDAWTVEEREKTKRAEEKKKKEELAARRRELMEQEIAERLEEEYGGDEARTEMNPFTAKQGRKKMDGVDEMKHQEDSEDNGEGGFIRDEDDENTAGGFIKEGVENDYGGGFMLDDEEPVPKPQYLQDQSNGDVISTKDNGRGVSTSLESESESETMPGLGEHRDSSPVVRSAYFMTTVEIPTKGSSRSGKVAIADESENGIVGEEYENKNGNDEIKPKLRNRRKTTARVTKPKTALQLMLTGSGKRRLVDSNDDVIGDDLVDSSSSKSTVPVPRRRAARRVTRSSVYSKYFAEEG